MSIQNIMDDSTYSTLLTEFKQNTLFVTLNRPAVRNAMSLEMVAELRTLFSSIESNEHIRAVVLRGANGHFCSGGDIKDMVAARSSAAHSNNPSKNFIDDPYYQLNRAYGLMLKELNALSKAVIAVVEGSAMGGGLGLVAVADVTLIAHNAKLTMPETRLGIIPAQIIPFVTSRIGEHHIRKMALFGLSLQGDVLQEYGFADHLFKDESELNLLLEKYIAHAARCAPNAIAITKELISRVTTIPLEQLLDQGAQAFARAIRSKEGIEGTLAFMQKRPPVWVPSQEPNPSEPLISSNDANNHQSTQNEVTHD